MLYRLYQPADFPALYAIEELCFTPPERFSRAYMRRLVYRRNSATWIAEFPPQSASQQIASMAGFAIVEWFRHSFGTAACIQTIEVLPGVRGRGIGREIMARLEQSALSAGCTQISLHVDENNAAAIRLYGRLSYQLRGRAEDYYGPNRPALIYTRPLAHEP